MTAPLGELDTDAVENVYIFVADSVRYDELPEDVAQRGVSFKTVAHALATPQCLPTMLSGRLPPEHGVTWFDHTIRESLPTLFDVDGFNTGYSELLWLGGALQSVLGEPPETDLESVDPPFIVVEHDNGGHAPYPESAASTTAETFEQLDSRDELLTAYRNAVQGSAQRFADRLQLLEQRGLDTDTLVIFVADHGELLADRNRFVGHELPMMPEVVFVPMVFIHPSLPAGERRQQLLQHVDIYPTVTSALTGRTPESDGANLTAEIEPNRPAYVQSIKSPPARFRDSYLDPSYDARGVWTRDGGHVFVKNPRLVRVLLSVYLATQWQCTASYNAHRSRISTAGTMLAHLLRNHHSYGEPAVGKGEAREILAEINLELQQRTERELSTETKEQLADLGYR